MANEWILDVIEDLRRFADLNDMPQLSQHLDQTAEAAMRELSGDTRYVPVGTAVNARHGGTFSRRLATSPDAG